MSSIPNAHASILLAEDDPVLAAMLKEDLERKGYSVWPAETGAEVESILKDASPDLIILDLILPDTNGLVLYFDIKAHADVPVIICSGTKRKEDAVLSLKLGAEDFISKPFSPHELQARVEAVLRRKQVQHSPQGDSADGCDQVGNLVVDRGRCRVTIDERDIQLTPTEYRLLSLIATRGDEVVAKKELAEAVWGCYDPDVARTLDVHMRRLRAKLTAANPAMPRLETVRGFGYRLTRDP